MPRRAAAGAGRGAEAVGLAGRGRAVDFAFGARAHFVERRLARVRAAGAVGQRFRAVHFVEVGFVDAGGVTGTTRGLPLTPTLSP